MYEKRFQRRRYQTRKLWRTKSWIFVRWIQDTMICHAEKEERYKRYAHNSIETMLKQNNFELIHRTNQYFGIVTQYHCAWTRANAEEFVAYVSVLFIFMFVCMQQGNKVGDTALSHWQFQCDWKSVCVAYWHLVFNMFLHCTFQSNHSKCTLHVNINLFVNV